MADLRTPHRTARIGVVILGAGAPIRVDVPVPGRFGEEQETLELLPGLYESERKHVYARISAIALASGEAREQRIGFGLNATCKALVSSVLRQPGGQETAVILDPGICIAPFEFVPGRVAYRLEHTNGSPLNYVEAGPAHGGERLA